MLLAYVLFVGKGVKSRARLNDQIDNEPTVAYNNDVVKHYLWLHEDIFMTGYLTIQQTSEKWGLSVRRINTLCNLGRIAGATKFGNTWAIPADAIKPKDERVKTGKYIKDK